MKVQNFIGGQFVDAHNGETGSILNPAINQVIGSYPLSKKSDVESAIMAATQACSIWRNTSIKDRSKVLERWAELVERDLEQFSMTETLNTGKPITTSRTVDIPRAVLNLRFFAKYAVDSWEKENVRLSPLVTERATHEVQKSPLGVVACISPWNLPLYLFTWKVAPALMAGNAVVAKPSEVTPMTAHLLAKLAHEAGIPDGVFNVIHGLGADIGETLVTHPKVKAISFTGSTVTGLTIAKLAAPHFKKLSLEMGGKNPVLVFADTDLDKAAQETVRAAFSNQGQICLCGSRVYVEKSIYHSFKEKLLSITKEWMPADPLKPETKLGAMVSKPHFEKVMQAIVTAKSEGGQILSGGKAVSLNGGYFIEPTWIEGLSQNCRTNQEEIFGPVATLTPFDSETQAIDLANSTRYGLTATVFTSNRERATRVAKSLESGMVWINEWMQRDLRTPFGGVKESGLGREGGTYALDFFSELKSITYLKE